METRREGDHLATKPEGSRLDKDGRHAYTYIASQPHVQCCRSRVDKKRSARIVLEHMSSSPMTAMQEVLMQFGVLMDKADTAFEACPAPAMRSWLPLFAAEG